MKRYKRLAAFFAASLFFIFCSCNNRADKTIAADIEGVSNLNFDSILNCYEYAYDEHYFFTADYGCIYDPKGKNHFGNLSVFLIPYKSIDSSRADTLAEKISSFNAAEIKREFRTYVYMIPPADLNYNASGDPVYYRKENYVEKLYGFDTSLKTWYFIDSINIATAAENEKKQKWRDDFIHSKISR